MDKTEIKILAFVFLLAAILGAIIFLDVDFLFNPIDIREDIEFFGFWAPFIFIGIYIISTVLFVPRTLFSIIAGIIFGSLWGSVYVIIAATLSAVVSFHIARYFGKEMVEKFVSNHLEKLSKYNDKLEKEGFRTVFLLRMVFFPFNVLNMAIAFTKVRFKDYFWATFFGVIPGSVIFTYFGNTLALQTTPGVTISAFLIFVYVLIILFFKKKEKYIFRNRFGVR